MKKELELKINQLLSYPAFSDERIKSLLDFLEIPKLAENLVDETDLNEIADHIRYGVENLNSAWEKIYAFNLRKEFEDQWTR